MWMYDVLWKFLTLNPRSALPLPVLWFKLWCQHIGTLKCWIGRVTFSASFIIISVYMTSLWGGMSNLIVILSWLKLNYETQWCKVLCCCLSVYLLLGSDYRPWYKVYIYGSWYSHTACERPWQSQLAFLCFTSALMWANRWIVWFFFFFFSLLKSREVLSEGCSEKTWIIMFTFFWPLETREVYVCQTLHSLWWVFHLFFSSINFPPFFHRVIITHFLVRLYISGAKTVICSCSWKISGRKMSLLCALSNWHLNAEVHTLELSTTFILP